MTGSKNIDPGALPRGSQADGRNDRSASDAVLRRLDDVPDRIDGAFWKRFSACFAWKAHRRALVFQPGLATLSVTTPITPRGSELDEPSPEDQERASPSRPGHGPRSGPETGRDEQQEASGPMLGDLVGHRRIVEVLSTVVDVARSQGGVLPSALFTGGPGLGKTTLAGALAREMGAAFRPVLGPLLDDPTVLLSHLAGLGHGDVLFLDEIHAVPRHVLEVLYSAVEGRYVDLPVIEGSRSKTVRLEIAEFTLVAATTDEAKLPGPLLTRFGSRLELDPLPDAEMGSLLDLEAKGAGLVLEPAPRLLLIRASLGVPRTGLRLIRTSIQMARHRDSSRVDWPDVIPAMRQLDLDGHGFNAVQRKVLDVLGQHGGPMGLDHLATQVGKPREAILELYEADLVRTGWVRRTPRGRVLARPQPRLRMLG